MAGLCKAIREATPAALPPAKDAAAQLRIELNRWRRELIPQANGEDPMKALIAARGRDDPRRRLTRCGTPGPRC